MVSEGTKTAGMMMTAAVLILVLVEDGFWEPNYPPCREGILPVLILVLVEDGFWVSYANAKGLRTDKS